MKRGIASFLISLLACYVYAEASTIRVYNKLEGTEFCLYDSIKEFNECREETFTIFMHHRGEIFERFDSYTIGFWKGEEGDRINYIKLKSDDLSLKMDGREILFFHRLAGDIERQIGTDYIRRSVGNDTVEYVFKTDSPIYGLCQ